MGPNQSKKLLHSKGNHQQNKEQSTEWQKLFANHISDKGLLSKIYFKTPTSTTTKNLIQEMDRGSEQTFFQRRYRDGQQAHEKNVQHHQLSGKYKSKPQ